MSSQRTYNIYNLTSEREQFECAGYLFQRVPDYDDVQASLYKNSELTLNPNTGRYVETQPQHPGVMAVTYHAVWGQTGPDPEALIHENAPLLYDVLLLWSLWSGEYVGIGDRSLVQSPTYFGDRLFPTRNALIKGIEDAISFLTKHDNVKALGVDPGLFMLRESLRTDVVNLQTLYISPIVDVLASKGDLRWSADQLETLRQVQDSILPLLEQLRPANENEDPLWRNVLAPLVSRVKGLGAPAAVDKLFKFLRDTPALADLGLSDEVLESHARAFNHFRNATLHYVGLPHNVKLSFGSGRNATVKRDVDRKQMLGALIYYTHAFRDLIMLHFIRRLGVEAQWGESRYLETLTDFFVDGQYNGHDWLAGAFTDNVDASGL